MTTDQRDVRRPLARTARHLLGAAHPGPAFAVTVLAGLLALASAMPATRAVLVVLAVLAGQLSIGWSNDIIDAGRDRRVGRLDKPIASGELAERWARLACTIAVLASVPLSLASGWWAGLVQLVLVAAGWAYNLGLKSTIWSWLPYAVAFGALPVFVALAADPDVVPALWVPLAGALLGVGAHLVNVLPDLDDDAATGVRGLPHRIGARWTPMLAVAVLMAASLTIVLGAGDLATGVAVAGLVVVTVLGVAAVLLPGRAPFRAAIGIALVDVLMLVASR